MIYPVADVAMVKKANAANVTSSRTVRLSLAAVVLGIAMMARTGDALDLMKLLDSRQHRSYKRAGESTFACIPS